MSVMEMSHRSKVFQKIFDDTKAKLRKLMNVPEEYEILRKLYLEKYTYEELAREMGLKKSALAMRVKRSKERFVKQWNRH